MHTGHHSKRLMTTSTQDWRKTASFVQNFMFWLNSNSYSQYNCSYFWLQSKFNYFLFFYITRPSLHMCYFNWQRLYGHPNIMSNESVLCRWNEVVTVIEKRIARLAFLSADVQFRCQNASIISPANYTYTKACLYFRDNQQHDFSLCYFGYKTSRNTY